MGGAAIDPDRLDVLRALADSTRNRLYRELQRSPQPLTTPELATRVALHPNTVRAHLDQLVAVGLVRADTARHGGRGRPRHRFSAVAPSNDPLPTAGPSGPPPAPPRGNEPDGVLARSLVRVAEVAGVDAEVIRAVGLRSGHDDATWTRAPGSTDEALRLVVARETANGYGPLVDEIGPGRWRVSFSTCPYRDLADQAPQVVCSLHAGSVEGMCAATGRLTVESFTPVSGDDVCHAVLSEAARDAGPEPPVPCPPTKEV